MFVSGSIFVPFHAAVYQNSPEIRIQEKYSIFFLLQIHYLFSSKSVWSLPKGAIKRNTYTPKHTHFHTNYGS